MKKGFAILLAAWLLFCLAACGQATVAGTGSEKRAEETETALPGVSVPDGRAEEVPTAQSTPDAEKQSGLYDPSIFVIEASGSWRQELAPGYNADYECELYLDKFDASDNRSASGLYTGVFWMKNTLDAADHLKDLLKDAPVEMDFAAGGEGICDNLTMHLLDGYERDPFGNYDIPVGRSGVRKPEKEALAGEGGFIAVGKQAYLDVQARGAGGEQIAHKDGQTGDAEISYIIQIEPDPAHTATERKATVYLSGPGGMSATIEGTWRRLPGYPDDRLEYANENKAGQVLERRLK